MIFLQFEGVPEPTNTDAAEVGGAFLNFWIACDDVAEAEALARRQLEEDKWRPIDFCDAGRPLIEVRTSYFFRPAFFAFPPSVTRVTTSAPDRFTPSCASRVRLTCSV